MPEAPGAQGARVVSVDRSARASSGRRRRRRWPVVLLVLVLLLGAAGVAAEYLARSAIGTAVRSAVPGLSQDATVSTEGLVLPQLVSGSLRTLTIEAGSLELEGAGGGSGDAAAVPTLEALTLSDVSATVSQVSLSSPYTASSIRASGTVPWEQVGAMVEESASGLSGSSVGAGQVGTSAEDPGTIAVQVSTFGVEGTAEVVPSVGADGGLVLTVRSVTAGDVRTEVGEGAGEEGSAVLASLGLDGSPVTVPAEEIPMGMTFSQVRVVEDGLHIELTGSDVDLAGT